MAVDGSDNVLVTGRFSGSPDFDPGPGTANLSSAGGDDAFVAKYDASGAYLWAFPIGDTGSDEGRDIATDGSDNVLVTGYWAGTADFDPGPAIAGMSSVGSDNIYVAKYSSAGTYQWSFPLESITLVSRRTLAIAVDGSDNLLIGGAFRQTVDFDPGPGTAGLSTTGSGLEDVFIAKYDASGAYQWAGQIGRYANDGLEVENQAVATDAWGNCYITGFFEGTADFDPGPGTAELSTTGNGDEDVFIAKYDASGAYQWAFKIGSSSNNEIGNDITVDGVGNVLVTGEFDGTVDFDPGPGTANLSSAGADDAFVAKYDASGAYLWAFSLGDAGSDLGYSMAVDGSDNVLVTGRFRGSPDFDPGPGTANLSSAGGSDIFVAKYDVSGAYQWAFNIGDAGFGSGYAITVDDSDNVLVAGNFAGTADFDPGPGTANLSSAGNQDLFVAKYSPAGAYQWAFGMGGVFNNDRVEAISVDGSNSILVTGIFGGTVDFDPGAGMANLSALGFTDGFVAKYDALGTYQWAFNFGDGNGSFEIGHGIAVDGLDNVLVTGRFGGTADFDPGAGTANLSSAGNDIDIFVAKYSASGAYQWAFSIGGPGRDDDGRDIAVDGLGNVLLTGYIRSLSDFDPGPGATIVASVNASDGFLAKYASCPPSGVFYVNDDASGANTGASWADAFNNLQDALTQAASCPNVTEIWVAAGTYTPDQGVGYTLGDRSHSFVMQNDLAIYGGFPGFPGQEGDFSARNPALVPTRLSGDIGMANNDADNSFHVIFNNNNGLDDSAILDGFIISGGNANGSGLDARGGGMYNRLVSPLIAGCIFTANSAASSGGGIYNSNPSTPLFVNCLFFSNTAPSGTGAFNDIASAQYVNCTFSVHTGFALSNVDARPVLANCILWGNGGSISNAGSLTNVATVTHSIVQGGYSGMGNLDLDPLFIDPAGGNFRLQEGSPAIDAGNNTEIPMGILNDLGGNPRILQSTVDMGAFEYRSNIPTMGQWAFLLFGLGVFTVMIVSLWNVRRVNA
jgi:hypothetical protein